MKHIKHIVSKHKKFAQASILINEIISEIDSSRIL